MALNQIVAALPQEPATQGWERAAAAAGTNHAGIMRVHGGRAAKVRYQVLVLLPYLLPELLPSCAAAGGVMILLGIKLASAVQKEL